MRAGADGAVAGAGPDAATAMASPVLSYSLLLCELDAITRMHATRRILRDCTARQLVDLMRGAYRVAMAARVLHATSFPVVLWRSLSSSRQYPLWYSHLTHFGQVFEPRPFPRKNCP